MGRLIESAPFAELVAKTNGSFLDGASHPEEMITRAKELGYAAIGIADTHGMYGMPRAHGAAKAVGLPLVVGAEIRVLDGTPVFLHAKNREGYGDLCELLTEAHASGERDDPRVAWEAVLGASRSLFALVPAEELRPAVVPELKAAFGDRLYLVASRFCDGTDEARLEQAAGSARRWELPVVASNRPLFHSPERKPLHDVLRCIHHNCTLKEGGFRLLPNAERFLKPRPALAALFAGFPEWLENTVRVAESCRFSLAELRYHYPDEWIPQGETADTYLEKLSWDGARDRYEGQIPDKVRAQLRHELDLIRELGYSDYFLTIWDVVRFARAKAILCQGRGSAANSIVCFVLGITAIDPVRMNLLFERFISRERCEPPDIDIDFEHERREEVIQYLYERYGRHRAAITAEVICFRRKSSLREVAKVFGIPEAAIVGLQTTTFRRETDGIPFEELQAASPDVPPRTLKRYLALVNAIQGFPRHLGTHVGGFVLCQDKLTRNVPVERAAMPGRTIIQWDKDDLDSLGFVKVDILGLGILTAIRKSLAYLKETCGVSLELATIPPEDPKVYERICVADTVGVFQIESRAQMNMLPRLKPRCFYDLVVEVSLVRPGPIQGEMVHPYLRRRAGLEPVQYPHPELEAILGRTYGVPLFQEQIMKMAMVVAGFTAGEADELRRAMGTWRRHGGNRLSPMGEKFKKGLREKGIPQEFADRVFRQIEGFAEYGFPESHAASFALLAYATAYLKCHYPGIFLAGLLNSQPMGFYSSHTLLHDGMRHGVNVSPADVNHSGWDNRLVSEKHLRLGFREIKGFRESVGLAIEKAREKGPFFSFPDLVTRVQLALGATAPALTKRDLFYLAGADALQSLRLPRREALWEIQALSLADSHAFSPGDLEPARLPKESTWETLTADYQSTGISLHEHPIAYFRAALTASGVTPSGSLAKLGIGKRVAVAGIVICRQMPPTKTGVLFLTLEDEEGFVNLVVWRNVFERYRPILLTQSFLLCQGKIEKAQGTNVVHVIAEEASPLLRRDTHSCDVHPLLPSHDFR